MNNIEALIKTPLTMSALYSCHSIIITFKGTDTIHVIETERNTDQEYSTFEEFSLSEWDYEETLKEALITGVEKVEDLHEFIPQIESLSGMTVDSIYITEH
jgi:hypothetical protein